MKKITLFITALSSGGAEHQLVNLAEMLVEKGYSVNLVTFSKLADHYKTPNGVHRIILGNGKSDYVKFFCILKYFTTLKDDVVISFGQRENLFSLLPLLINRKVKMIAGERNITYTPSRIDKLLLNYLYKRANWIVPNSHTQGRYLTTAKEYLKEKVVVITNYTDLEHFTYSDCPNNKIQRIGVFCRYNSQKNTERFAEALSIVKKRHGSIFHVDWYGNKSFKGESLEPTYMRFEQLIKEYNLSDVITLHDKTSNVHQIMTECDAICLPSLYEGFSNTLSEAICTGRVCLASNVSDNSVMVEDGNNGFLFNPLDVSDIAASFTRLFEASYVEKKQMSHNSRKKALELFSKDRFINDYIKLIES